ncbi:cyclic GMP-AMP synthase-like isoform X2 [Sitophilus oryzae]|nr:cyclic GMP-AMP synthase-like isoform X2 [Sitophilus oryzae]XP_030754676.1 cyclic GMP-AMP synthase-like isoform X2 [Sitophilus oryzae]
MKMYYVMDEVLQLINKNFVSLDNEDIKGTNRLLHTTLNKMVEYMKEDPIFKLLYIDNYFGGSFYDKLKVEKPDEFDIDFVFSLPECETCKIKKCRCITLKTSNTTGFLCFKIKKNCCTPVYKNFVRNGYMQTNLIFNWIKSLIMKAISKVNAEQKRNNSRRKTHVSLYSECAPAVKICIKNKKYKFHIDLAPAFQFDQSYWPKGGFKKNPSSTEQFSVVPMSPRDQYDYWRPSFQAQEKKIIANKERMKPALRLLKKMKSNRTHQISSYALKTLIMEEADNVEWSEMSLGESFMLLLEKYIDALQDGHIWYYWNTKVNLLGYLKKKTVQNHLNEILKIYCKVIQEYEDNPIVIAELILKKDSKEYRKFINLWNRRQLQNGIPNGNNDIYLVAFDSFSEIFLSRLTLANKHCR